MSSNQGWFLPPLIAVFFISELKNKKKNERRRFGV
jgi:hypothetical protein